MTPDLAEVERRMQPGAWFPRGFLAPGTSLARVLEADAARLAALGVTAGQVGGRLAELLESAGGSDWFLPALTGGYRVALHRRRGMITCPWAPDELEPCAEGAGGHPTANEFVVRRGLARRLSGFELSVHLIRDHGFFGGPGSSFRIEPEEAVELLGMGTERS